MKILFIQLPLQDHSHGYINGNIDYAAAAISGFISEKFRDISCLTLPSVIANFGSDELIVKYILSVKPDYISFTSYLWNIERNLRIAETVKAIPKTIPNDQCSTRLPQQFSIRVHVVLLKWDRTKPEGVFSRRRAPDKVHFRPFS